MHSLQMRGCRASMGAADIQSATELVFVLRCGRRLRALQTNKQLDHFAAAAKSAERDRPIAAFHPLADMLRCGSS
ncbi:hypothetical protein, partial [uncultured Sulfitobacter sp.]|uniref:hypothetical protein n=1 Tax=uncultured Sulfitobacter sp. TaxID=191468 RepID=UPI0030DD05C1